MCNILLQQYRKLTAADQQMSHLDSFSESWHTCPTKHTHILHHTYKRQMSTALCQWQLFVERVGVCNDWELRFSSGNVKARLFSLELVFDRSLMLPQPCLQITPLTFKYGNFWSQVAKKPGWRINDHRSSQKASSSESESETFICQVKNIGSEILPGWGGRWRGVARTIRSTGRLKSNQRGSDQSQIFVF